MKKYFYMFLLSVMTALNIFLITELNNIKTVYGTNIKKVYHTETLNVSGEFENPESTEIILSYPVCIKDIFIKENTFVNQGQALFSIDKEKMLEYLAGNIDDNLLQWLDYSDLNLLSGISEDLQKSISSLPDKIYAASEGIVSQLNVYPGAIIMPQQTLAVISPSDNMLAKFSLSQLDYGKISIGDSVSITPVAFQNSQYEGIISRQNAIIKKQSTAAGNKVVVEVFATIINPDKKISDGLQINGVVHNSCPQQINALDYTYINQDNEGQYVYVFSDGYAEKVYIETGIESENYTEIITPFPEGTIFIDGAEIQERDRVILKQ